MSLNRTIIYLLVFLALGGLVLLDRDTGNDFEGQKAEVQGATETSAAADKTPEANNSDPRLAKVAHAMTDRWSNPLAAAGKESLNNTVDRPLFSPSRRKPEPVKRIVKQVAVKQKPKPNPPLFELLGVVKNNDRTVAILKQKNNDLNFSVEAGDMIAGWKVSEVDRRSVRLKWTDGRNMTLAIFKD